MKKIVAAILTVAFLVAIVATPSYKVNSPSFKVGSSVYGNQNSSGDIFTQ